MKTLGQLHRERYSALLARQEQQRERYRGSAASRGYDALWRKRRELQLLREPLCRACKAAGRLVAATDVDHIIALRKGGADHFDNYQSLCHACHSAKTAREDGAFGREPSREPTQAAYYQTRGSPLGETP